MGAPRRLLCPELVGREHELEMLGALLDETSGLTTALVGGDAGIGKSALLRHFIAGAGARALSTLVGRCTEVEARRPFGPFVDVLRHAARAIPTGWLGPAFRGHLSPLVALAPELAPHTLVRPDEGTDRYRVYDAFLSLLTEAGRSDVGLVVVEDLHWADEASLELFAYLARRMPERSVRIVGSYRTDELQRTHPLRPVVVDLERSRAAIVLRLGPLDRAASNAVVRATLGTRAVPPDLLDLIAERCEGNAFFIEETLKTLVEEGHLRSDAGTWQWWRPMASGVPASIRDAVQIRLDRLSRATLGALQVAAVIGHDFRLDLLERVTGTALPEIVGALREAVSAQVIDETADRGSEAFAFRHALTRECVLDGLLLRDRRELHLRIGNAIEEEAGLKDAPGPDRSALDALAAAAERLQGTQPGDEHAEELAYHFDEAGDQARAHHYHLRAGAVGARSFAARRAIRHYERGIELGPADGRVLGPLYFSLAVACAQALDWRRGYDAAEHARDQFAAVGDRIGVGSSVRFMSFCLYWYGSRERSNALLDESLEILEPLGPSFSLAETLTFLAMRALGGTPTALSGRDGSSEVTAALDLARRAEEMTRDSENARLRVQVLSTLALAMARAGMPEAVGFARDALAFAHGHRGERQDRVQEAQGAVHRAYTALREILRLTGAPWTDREVVYAEQLRHAIDHGYRNMFFIEAQLDHALADGDWDEALERASELAVTPGSTFGAAAELRAAFMSIARAGPREGSDQTGSAFRTLMSIEGLREMREASFAVLVHLLAGEDGAALEVAERVYTTRPAWLPAEILALAAIAAARSPDHGAAERWIGRATAEALGIDPALAALPGLVARGAVAIRDRRDGDALRALGAAAALLSEEHLPHVETFVRLRRAEIVARTSASEAATELKAVLPYWRKAKADWYLRQLGHWARERGIKLDRLDRAGIATKGRPAGALTKREREVAVLVAQGLTNRQIGERLVISERTAETHVEQIRSKLGFRSRAQIAGWVAQNR